MRLIYCPESSQQREIHSNTNRPKADEEGWEQGISHTTKNHYYFPHKKIKDLDLEVGWRDRQRHYGDIFFLRK